MSFKYAVGQAVEYKPIGANIALFVVVRRMPEEFQAVDRKYCIKSAREGFERNVMECDLSPSTANPPRSVIELSSPNRGSAKREFSKDCIEIFG